MRLIDADKFKEDLMKLWDYSCVDGITATTVLKQVLHDIDNAPTVAERPQGTWKHIIDEYNDVECPFCGFQEDGIYYSFCPSCGAKLAVDTEADRR